jgi:hypothetical protein
MSERLELISASCFSLDPNLRRGPSRAGTPELRVICGAFYASCRAPDLGFTTQRVRVGRLPMLWPRFVGTPPSRSPDASSLSSGSRRSRGRWNRRRNGGAVWSGHARLGRRTGVRSDGRTRRYWPAVAPAEAPAVGQASLASLAGTWTDTGSGLTRRASRCGRRRRRAAAGCLRGHQYGGAVVRADQVQATGMVRLLERGRVAQPRFTRAFEDAKALVSALVLDAPHALVHRQLAGDLPAAVLQLL